MEKGNYLYRMILVDRDSGYKLNNIIILDNVKRNDAYAKKWAVDCACRTPYDMNKTDLYLDVHRLINCLDEELRVYKKSGNKWQVIC